jgi:aldose sugar dehydrogenase
MIKKESVARATSLVLAFVLLISSGLAGSVYAQDEPDGPVILDPRLDVRTVVSGLDSPTTMAFLDGGQMFVLEKSTGQVKHIVEGEVAHIPLDLGVNFASERGLLGIALDPDFENNGYVYLYWTCKAPPPEGEGYFPTQVECLDEPEFGEDTDDVLAVPLLGNRVDRFVWDGESLTWDLNLVKLLAFQNDGAPIPRGQGDEEQPPRGNHDGGVITFGQDGKLYILIGDVGRRGFLQNLPFGPIQYSAEPAGAGSQDRIPADLSEVTPEQLGVSPGMPNQILPGQGRFGQRVTVPDDQFGGPFPDDAHFTGVILRLNTDGSIPEDNPFFDFGAQVGGEIGENIQMIFAYGIRNSFGMDTDPVSGLVVDHGERRRCLRRTQPGPPRVQLRLDPDHGTCPEDWRIQADRNNRSLQ